MTHLKAKKVAPVRIPDGATLCLFGLGILAWECYPQIVQMLGREPDYLCDNDASKWNTRLRGVTCISPADLAALSDVFVVVASKATEAILAQVKALGLHRVAIVDYERAYDRVRCIRETDGSPAPSIGLLSVMDRWVMITGASRGLGRLIALDMARRGANLILLARRDGHLDGVASLCAPHGKDVIRESAEFSDPAQIEACLNKLVRAVPRIDIVFNNAGISPPSAPGFWKTPAEDYLTAFQVNALAPILISQTLIPGMRQRGFGRIIHLTSSIRNRMDEMAYACSKAALDKFVYDLSFDLAETGVMVSLADPGWLRTDMGGGQAPHAAESALPGVLMGALLNADVNGRCFSAQDYAGLDLEDAARKACLLLGLAEAQ